MFIDLEVLDDLCQVLLTYAVEHVIDVVSQDQMSQCHVLVG